MKVERFVNSIFTSNSYIVYFEEIDSVYVVDPGDSKPILDWIKENNKFLKGIFITHSHFDHIYGVNDLYDVYPHVEIYASKYAKEGMLSAKLNRSYYTENPFVVKCSNIEIVDEGDKIPILEDIFANVIYTPGHNNDCLSFKIFQHLFTGDALIPGIKVYTKSKAGDKIKAKESIIRIINQFKSETLICPGHGEICSIDTIEVTSLYNP